jgi:hypothetical protein
VAFSSAFDIPMNSEPSIFIAGHAGGPAFIDFVFALNDFAAPK